MGWSSRTSRGAKKMSRVNQSDGGVEQNVGVEQHVDRVEQNIGGVERRVPRERERVAC